MLITTKFGPQLLSSTMPLFSAANQAGVTTSAGLSTTAKGIILYNPIGSTVNLVLKKVGYAFTVAFAAASAIGLAVGYNGSSAPSSTTALTPMSNFVGSTNTGQGVAYSAATLPTAPVVAILFGTGDTGAITTVPGDAQQFIDLEGEIILPPGAYAMLYTSTASGTSGCQASMEWYEVPVAS